MKLKEETMRLYAVTNKKIMDEKRYPDLYAAVEAAIKGGATMIQLREKELSEEAFLEEAHSIRELTWRYHIPFIINDNVRLAKICQADGVHLGQGDMHPEEARKILGRNAIIGVSAHNVEEALLAEEQGADYLGCGSVFHTVTKKDVNALSIQTLRDICQAVTIPVVAIGGVNEDNIDRLTGCKLAGVAVVAAIFGKEDIEQSARHMRNLVDNLMEHTQTFLVLYQKLQPVLKDKKAVVFDMDGTLIDSMPMWRNLDVLYMGGYGIYPDKEFHHKVATMTLLEAAEYIKQCFEIPKTAQEIFDDFQNMVTEQYQNHIPLKKFAYELVIWLKRDGYQVGVATANEINFSQMVLERTGLTKYVDTMVSCTMVGASKEFPDVYDLACQNMHVKREECVVFEDSLRAIYTAKKAGFQTVAVYDSVAEDSWKEICEITDEQVVFA